MADAPKILGTDSLRESFPKLNSAIDNSNEALTKATTAESNSAAAVNTANTAETKAESVQAQFNQVVIEGDSSVEAAQARVKADGTTYTTLQERLNNSDAQLAQKANQEEVIVRGLGTLNDFDEQTRAVLQGLEPGQINAVLGKRNVKNENLDDKVISPRNTTFAKMGRNLFDGIYEKGSFTGVSPFTFNGNTNGKVAIVKIKPLKTYTVSKSTDTDRFRIATSNSLPTNSMVLVSSSSKITDSINPKTFTASDTDNYLIVYVSSDGNEPSWLQVEEGSVATEFTKKITIDLSKESIPTIDPAMTNFFEKSKKNLFDGNYIRASVSGSSSEGYTFSQTSTSTAVCAIVELESNKTYTLSKSDDTNRFRWFLYNDFPVNGAITYEGLGLSSSEPKTITTTTNKYLVILVSTSDEGKEPSWLQVEEGIKATDYKPPFVIPLRITEYEPEKTPSFFIEDKEVGAYDPSELYLNISDFNNDVSVLYGLYDNLLQNSNGYISKTLLGNESTGLPINRYDFTPSKIRGNSGFDFPKIVVIGSIHGMEKQSVIDSYKFFYDLTNNWLTNDALSYLRANVQFVFIPCLNPYGFNNHLRTNANNVDLNRNFPYGWSSTIENSGASPLSEVESQLVSNLLTSEKNVVYVLDYHNYNTFPTTADDIFYMTTVHDDVEKMLYGYLLNLNTKLKRTYNYLPQDNTQLTRLIRSTPNGQLSHYCYELGIKSSLMESVISMGGTDIDMRSASASAYGNLFVAILKQYSKLKLTW